MSPAQQSGSADESATDAILLLTSDHEEVKQMFEDYAELVEAEGPSDERQALAAEICQALTVHATIEEEILYPAARDALDDEDLVDEAQVEHDGAKDLIAQIMEMDADDELFDAKVTVLGEYIEHHVKEEEGEMFPKLRESELDLETLGEEMLVRKEQLEAEIEADADRVD